MTSNLLQVYTAKASRVYVSGMLSILLPFYLTTLGYSPFFVGLALASILAGNAASNIVLTYFERIVGRRRLLLLFSLLMLASGLALALAPGAVPIIAACFIGNISTTGTEAGPFQSVETGILPELAGGGTTRAFGTYNLIGYVASAAGAFTASAPGYLGGGLLVYRALFMVFGSVGALLFAIYSVLPGVEGQTVGVGRGPSSLAPEVRRDVAKLSTLYSVDAFGGSFVSQYVLTYWFQQSFGAGIALLGTVFLSTNLISALSTYGAAVIAGKFGNLRTMFSTHLVSNLFLLLIPFAGSLVGALSFLFVRQSMSQMDVPTRQAFMAEVFAQNDRVTANAITNTSRSVSSFLGGPVSAAMFGLGLLSAPILAGGISKVAYDLAIFANYRKRFR